MTCNKAWEWMVSPFDLAFDRKNWKSDRTGPDRSLDFISLMTARRHDCRDRRNVRDGNIRTMNRCSRCWARVVEGVGLSLAPSDGPAVAGDLPSSLPVKAPVPYHT